MENTFRRHMGAHAEAFAPGTARRLGHAGGVRRGRHCLRLPTPMSIDIGTFRAVASKANEANLLFVQDGKLAENTT